jgi:imidazole glycerol-phosphate synthase subunit HisF
MKKHRVIPVLLLRNGFLVQSKQFKRYQNLGNPVSAVKRLSEWGSDELIYLDITSDDSYDMRRDDLGHPNRNNLFDIIEDVSKMAFMPMTVGGRIRSLEDIEKRLLLGADKIAINSKPLEDPAFIELAAREFGSQCIVVSMDVRLIEGQYQVFAEGGKQATGRDPLHWALQVEQLGAGEILLNSIDRDGVKNGYDLDLLNRVVDAVRIPVIACGGVGEWSHFGEALQKTGVDAVAAANIFHYVDQSVYLAKKYLREQGLNVRSPELLEV